MQRARLIDPRHGWNMHEDELKRQLGLPKKLPPRAYDGRFHYVGEVQGLGIFDRGQVKGRRCHRLYALVGDRFVPAGRLHQYKGGRR